MHSNIQVSAHSAFVSTQTRDWAAGYRTAPRPRRSDKPLNRRQFPGADRFASIADPNFDPNLFVWFLPVLIPRGIPPRSSASSSSAHGTRSSPACSAPGLQCCRVQLEFGSHYVLPAPGKLRLYVTPEINIAAVPFTNQLAALHFDCRMVLKNINEHQIIVAGR